MKSCSNSTCSTSRLARLNQRTDFLDHKGDQTVIHIDVAASLHNFGDVFVVKPQDFLITFFHVLIVQRELDHFSLLELNLGCATLALRRENFF